MTAHDPTDVTCTCGHAALDHHGIDPADGCLGVVSHRLPQCPCAKTATQVVAEIKEDA